MCATHTRSDLRWVCLKLSRPRARLVGNLCVRCTLLDRCKIRSCRTTARYRLDSTRVRVNDPGPTSDTHHMETVPSMPIPSSPTSPSSLALLYSSLPFPTPHPTKTRPSMLTHRRRNRPLCLGRLGRDLACRRVYTVWRNVRRLCASSPNGPRVHEPFLPHSPSTQLLPPPSRFMPHSSTISVRLYASIMLVLPSPSPPFVRTSAHPRWQLTAHSRTINAARRLSSP
ncbi:hypothetical protein B0H14DRAFT_3484190 [Mycena olivaceomarginata]|nr:hypothetical protein B0H14DRAFT_3484190 [Mycena olivaceomarginata]